MGWRVEAEFLESVFERLEQVAWPTPVYYPNVNAALPTVPHYRAAVLPVDGQNLDTRGKTRRTWLFQVTAAVKAGVGQVKLAQMIDTLSAAFLVNSVVGQFRQVDVGNTAPVIVLDGWAFAPVTYKFEVIS